MRAAPDVVVVDAAILIAALLGRSALVIETVGRRAALVTTDRAIAEARRRVELGLKRPELIFHLHALVAQIEVVSVEALDRLSDAAQWLRDAMPSRNAATGDDHIVALAWQADADVWSHDRDFAGTGVASWSTINLLVALALI